MPKTEPGNGLPKKGGTLPVHISHLLYVVRILDTGKTTTEDDDLKSDSAPAPGTGVGRFR
jgi:hypothetical protein